jgi:protein TonB
MPFQALLFCPDEKTARTLTQVLGELEFAVESCMEPFGAVKKLMSQHFDALVVDCDNEQNATLLFKSARNSTSNQASLAVAIVEGQAGVAKAFRIGANLVLTKPINVEQSKGTLRVARGLLRKGEPGKPATPSPAAAPAATAAPPTPVKPVPARAMPPARPSAAAAPAAVKRPVVPAAKSPADVAAAMAAESSGLAPQDEIPAIKVQSSSTAPALPPAVNRIAPSVAPAAGSAVRPSFDLKSESPASSFGSSAAASAPAPAREAQPKPVHIFDKPAQAGLGSAPALASPEPAHAPAPALSFTFGGANAPEESGGGSKKILLGIAAVVVVAAALYAGWNHIAGRASGVARQMPLAAPASPAAKPSSAPVAQPAASATTPSALPTTQPATSQSVESNPASTTASDDQPSTTSDEPAPADITLSTKPASPSSSKPSAASLAKKPAASAQPASQPAPQPASAAPPLVVKGGAAPAIQAKPTAPDTPPPSVIGMAPSGADATLPNLGASESAPKPILQRLTVSQGVSQGLLVKRVQPVYPKTALAMHIEGTVELTATVSKSGDITTVKVLKGDPQLARAAMDAVKEWKYKPYLLNGEPVEIQTQVTMTFKLPN